MLYIVLHHEFICCLSVNDFERNEWNNNVFVASRWLVSQGKVDKAIVILKKFERINKSKVPDSVYSEFQVRVYEWMNE